MPKSNPKTNPQEKRRDPDGLHTTFNNAQGRQHNQVGDGQQFNYEHMTGTQSFYYGHTYHQNIVYSGGREPDREPGQKSESASATGPEKHTALGICLGRAPLIEPDAFKGREQELRQLGDLLPPDRHLGHQCIVSLVGTGGVGKTQLSLAHVREYGHSYSSVFWVSARDAMTLQHEVAQLSPLVFPEFADESLHTVDDEQHAIDRARHWLSQPDNHRWLLIFDNYDDPDLPGLRSSTGFDIRTFFPIRSQGSILITTRSPKLTFSRQLAVSRLPDHSVSVSILSQRSGRDLADDAQAHDLARRLGGLPLALATAGTFLASANVTCADYRHLYESMWAELFSSDTEELFEYPERTLSSTWTISLNQVRAQHEDAAELLQFWAFFSPHDIWYELLQAGVSDHVPWLQRVSENPIRFQQAMSKLRDYSLVEVVSGRYQLHPCLHDWLVNKLSVPPEKSLFVAATSCVAHSIYKESSSRYWDQCRRLLDHIEQLDSGRLSVGWQTYLTENDICDAARCFAHLQANLNLYVRAEQMYLRALAGKEKVLGPDHISTLAIVNNLGALYWSQSRLDEAERMYLRALAGIEKFLEAEHPLTLSTISNLAVLYRDQGKLDIAEQMYVRALAESEQALGPEHNLTLNIAHNLGILYCSQSELDKAEQMHTKALAGYEKVLGGEHVSTLGAVNNLGLLYSAQGNLERAEQMYERALTGYEKVLGAEHSSTLNTIHNLGILYTAQGRLEVAEQMYTQVLAGKEKVLGLEHISTLRTVDNFGVLYFTQGKLQIAEQMYTRALAGKVKALGAEHTSTLGTVHNLGVLYCNQDKLEIAEQTLVRALIGREKALGPDHPSTLDSKHRLALLYVKQGRHMKAERQFKQALAGFEKALGSQHPSTLRLCHNLSTLYRVQGRLEEAETVLERTELP